MSDGLPALHGGVAIGGGEESDEAAAHVVAPGEHEVDEEGDEDNNLLHFDRQIQNMKTKNIFYYSIQLQNP